MDNLWCLPGEIRAEILGHINREDLNNVTEASPALRSAYKASPYLIHRSHTMRDLMGGNADEGSLQDALAVINFPEFRVDDVHAHLEHDAADRDLELPLEEGDAANGRTRLTDAHLKRWAAGGFPNPFVTGDWETVARLDRLCRFIWLYASDLLAKATHLHLPSAYDILPPWAVQQTGTDPKAGTLADPRRQHLHCLTWGQRSRILRAFLRYELLCKVYRPVAGRRPTFPNCGCTLACKPWKKARFGPFRRWRWDVLHQYRGEAATRRELEALASVREYISCTLTKAAGTPNTDEFAGLGPSHSFVPSGGDVSLWVTRDSDPAARRSLQELLRLRSRGMEEQYASALTTFGLGMLHHCLRLQPSQMDELLQNLSMDMNSFRQRPEPTSVKGMIVHSDTAPWHADLSIVRLDRQRATELLRRDDGTPPDPIYGHLGRFEGRWDYERAVEEYSYYQWRKEQSEVAESEEVDRTSELIVHGCHRAFASLRGQVCELWEQRLPEEFE